jgi:Uma2 family endonuclease
MSTLPKHFITPEEYLEIERKAETKSEYYKGAMFAMSGVSRSHSRLTTRLSKLIGNHLDEQRCEMHIADMRVRVSPVAYCYPDLAVVCGEPKFADNEFDTLLNPNLLVEILSPSTAGWDRGRKAQLYRAIPFLQEYLIIGQEAPEITLYRRTTAGWTVIDASGMDREVELLSIGYSLRLRDLYQGIVSEAEASA